MMFGDRVIAEISFTQRFGYFKIEPQYIVIEFVISWYGKRKIKVYSHGRPIEQNLWKANELYICLIKPWLKGYLPLMDLITFCENFKNNKEISIDNNVIRVPNLFWSTSTVS